MGAGRSGPPRGEVGAVAQRRRTPSASRPARAPRVRAGAAVARAGVVPFPRGRARRKHLRRLLPSARSLLAGVAIAATAGAAYLGARESGVFSVERIRVEGAPPGVAAQVERALASGLGRNLLELRMADLERSVAAIPAVASVRLDRAFPHTLRAVVTPERPLAVLRRGSRSWLVAASGRVVAPLERRARPRLPRIWAKPDTRIEVGATAAGEAARAVTALAAVRRADLGRAVASAVATGEGLALVLRDGVEVRLGDTAELALKLAVARAILPRVYPPAPGATSYLDVSVPERPVAGEQPQVEG